MKKIGIVLVALILIATIGVYFANQSEENQAIDSELVDILIQEFSLDPPEITIHAGTEVRWINLDATRHNVTAQSGEFDSPILRYGDQFSYVFEKTGEYAYFNKYFPTIKGKIVVVP